MSELDFTPIHGRPEISLPSGLENMYVCFRLPPFGSPRIRAVKKEKKLYLWDWSAVPDPGARFESLVACQLLKYCHWVEDTEGFRMELRHTGGRTYSSGKVTVLPFVDFCQELEMP